MVRLHNITAMFESAVNGVYTFNGVPKQVGWSSDLGGPSGFTQPRARVWSGTAASAIDLTPAGWLYGVINAGNGDGPSEVLCGHIGATVGDQQPTIWTGTGGAYRTLDTTTDEPLGSVIFCTQNRGVGYLKQPVGAISHAAIWNLLDGSVLDLHSFLPPEYQVAGASSTAFFKDALGNVYG